MGADSDHHEAGQPFSLLARLYGDAEMTRCLSAEHLVEHWLAVEQALARAQAEAGLLEREEADAISALDAAQLDQPALWEAARNVGYPILPLVRQMAALLPDGANGRVHFAATTQDVMDTGVVLQLVSACDLLVSRLDTVGDLVAGLVREHSATVMPGRTHGQHAVPTTFGAHLAPVLAEITRCRRRLQQAREEVSCLSLFGAGGTSAAMGETASSVRRDMAAELGLHSVEVSWHTSRDNLVAVAHAATLLTGICARLARNVVDLSRTEIAEVREADGMHRGASSTMPQKANPILAEGIIGMAAIVGPLSSSLTRAMEAPQERAAGEWQIEWHVLPQALQLTSNCLQASADLLGGLRVEATAMHSNLDHDGKLILAEAYMFQLATSLGRETAHDVVYAAARAVRGNGGTLATAVRTELAQRGLDTVAVGDIDASEYLGQTSHMCHVALDEWAETRATAPARTTSRRAAQGDPA